MCAVQLDGGERDGAAGREHVRHDGGDDRQAETAGPAPVQQPAPTFCSGYETYDRTIWTKEKQKAQ